MDQLIDIINFLGVTCAFFPTMNYHILSSNLRFKITTL